MPGLLRRKKAASTIQESIATRLPVNQKQTTRNETGHTDTIFAHVTLTLTRWPCYMNMIKIFWWCIGVPKVNFLSQGFQKLKRDRKTNRLWDRRDWRHYHAVFAAGKIHKCTRDRQACIAGACQHRPPGTQLSIKWHAMSDSLAAFKRRL